MCYANKNEESNISININRIKNTIYKILVVFVVLNHLIGIMEFFTKSLTHNVLSSIQYITFMNVSNGITVLGIALIIFSIIMAIIPLVWLFLSKSRKQFLCFVVGPYVALLVSMLITVFFSYSTFVFFIRYDVCILLISIFLSIAIMFIRFNRGTKKGNLITIGVLVLMIAISCSLTIISFRVEKNKFDNISENRIEIDHVVFDPNSDIKKQIVADETLVYQYRNQNYSLVDVDIIAKMSDKYLYCSFYKNGNKTITVFKTITSDIRTKEEICVANNRAIIGNYVHRKNNNGFVFNKCFYYIFDNEDKLYNKDDVLMYDMVNDTFNISKLDLDFIDEKTKIDNLEMYVSLKNDEYNCNYLYDFEMGELLKDKLHMSKYYGNKYWDNLMVICFDDDIYLVVKTTSREHFMIIKIDYENNEYDYVGTIKMDGNTSIINYLNNELSNINTYSYCPEYYFVVD